MSEQKEKPTEAELHGKWEEQQAQEGISVHLPRAKESVPVEGKKKAEK